ncbi:hypothetical protein GCM10023093_15440 [Nemorincola caseinilytica]|uniref:Cthe-2314-like HEPN domain-containing protein n=1 Tax=Nemorincola caseinilytica TaxID=2054315 RepID=A0ABP8NEP9_9BACT
MKLGKKNTTEDFYEDYFNEYEDALKEFCGGLEYIYTNGFEDEVYNYRQLIKFLGEKIVSEEQETEIKINNAWNADEDIRYQYSHVKSLREFTLHATFISIHSMYEGRLREYCVILAHYDKVKIRTDGHENAAGLLNKIYKNVRPSEENKNKKLREFYCKIRNTLVHHKGYLNSKKEEDAALMNKIKQNKYLGLTPCNVGLFDNKLHINKSIFLTDYLKLISQDLEIISRSAMKL